MRYCYCFIVSILLCLPITAETSVLKKAELRVLDIGNSYTTGATRLLPLITTASKTDLSTMCLYQCYRSGASFKNWVDIYNKAFMSQKRYNTWVTSAMFLGIYVGLLFIMGLLLWLLTRGKNNMFNYLKFMDTQKMAWWAALCPGILAMIVGFIFSNFAQMAFIVLLGLRTMWIAMKQLRPQY